MPDERAVRKKVIVRMLGHPVVLAPFLAGATAGTAVLAASARVGMAAFALVAGTLISMGMFITRLVADDGRTARRIWDELETENRRSQQAALDDLDRRLSTADRDPRPETALRDLRALIIAFEQVSASDSAVHGLTIVEVRSKVQQIFQQSVHSLEQTLKLGEIAQRLMTPAARAPILEERERLIADIEAGTRQLGGTLAALQRLADGDGSNSELGRLRTELDRSLDLAATVEARLQALLDQSNATVGAPTKPSTLEQKG